MERKTPITRFSLVTLGTKEEGAEVVAWLNDNAESNDFAASVLKQFIKYDGLSKRQWDAIRSKVAKEKDGNKIMDINEVKQAGLNSGLTLSNSQRGYCRKAITSNALWKEYRKRRGLTSADISSTSDVITIADDLGINLREVLQKRNEKIREGMRNFKDIGKGDNNDDGEQLGARINWSRVREVAREEAEKVAAPKIIERIIIDREQEKIELGKDGEIFHPKFADLLQAVTIRDYDGNRINVMLVGPASSGKTKSTFQLAAALNTEARFQSVAAEPYDLLGFVDAAGNYHEPAFVDAFRNGFVCLVDEFDAEGWENSARLALNSALANGVMELPNGEQVTRHENFVCVAACNTNGFGATSEYVGRTQMDLATISRFPIVIDWQIDPDLELKLTQVKCQNDARAIEWLEECQKVRKVMDTLGLPAMADNRTVQAGAALLMAGVPLHKVRELTYLSRLDADQRLAVEQKRN